MRAACARLLAAPAGAWHEEDWRRTHPEFPSKYALAIHVYSRQDPNVYSPLGDALHDSHRANGPGGVSVDGRAGRPFVKLLDVAIVEAAKPDFWGFFIILTNSIIRSSFFVITGSIIRTA